MHGFPDMSRQIEILVLDVADVTDTKWQFVSEKRAIRSDKVKNPSKSSKSSHRIGKRFVRFVRFVRFDGFVGLSDRIAMETHSWISKSWGIKVDSSFRPSAEG
jgi:hypothetical protein